jgi:hypothetical protein
MAALEPELFEPLSPPLLPHPATRAASANPITRIGSLKVFPNLFICFS